MQRSDGSRWSVEEGPPGNVYVKDDLSYFILGDVYVKDDLSYFIFWRMTELSAV